METTTVVEIGDSHCDSLGHLNHVEAVRVLEDAREDWYAACGLYEGLEPGVYLQSAVVVNINYNYRLECFHGETIKAITRGATMGTKSFVLEHEIIKADGSVAIDGACTSVIMDIGGREIIPVPACMAKNLTPR